MLAAGAGHALDDVAVVRAGEPGDVHLDAFGKAQAAWPLAGGVGLRDSFGKARRSGLEAMAADQVGRAATAGLGAIMPIASKYLHRLTRPASTHRRGTFARALLRGCTGTATGRWEGAALS